MSSYSVDLSVGHVSPYNVIYVGSGYCSLSAFATNSTLSVVSSQLDSLFVIHPSASSTETYVDAVGRTLDFKPSETYETLIGF